MRQGLLMNWKSNFSTGLAVGLAVFLLASPNGAWAQKGASDKLVKHFAQQAFQSLPETIKTSDGKEIKIDKSKASQILVPDDQLRQVILVASQVSTAAQCKMEELANSYWVIYRKSLKQSGKWTDPQRFFMARVFNVAVGFASAKEATANDGEKEITLKSFKKIECSDKKREKLKAQILANIKVLQKT